jgi:hypothetical protein
MSRASVLTDQDRHDFDSWIRKLLEEYSVSRSDPDDIVASLSQVVRAIDVDNMDQARVQFGVKS